MLGGATDHIPATRPPRRRLARCRVPANGGPRSVVRPFVHRSSASCDINVLPFETHVNKPKTSLPTTDYALKLEVIFCVQGVISPLLANLFMHYSFDMWMARTYPHIPFERYADDAICHCKSAEEARELWRALADRFGTCKLVLHPEKTKIVYCKDANRRDDFPVIAFDFLGYQFRARKTMWRKGEKPIFAHRFQPAASPKALKRIGGTIRRWSLHHRSDVSLTELAAMHNPCIRGWIGYYGHFFKTQLRPTLKRIDAYVIRWARRKFSGCAIKPKVHGTGSAAFVGRTGISLRTGSYAMATAEHREPCDSRGSCTVLGAPGGESPPGDSTSTDQTR